MADLQILTAHQPVYLPWLGLFHKIALADQYCVFDMVQYQRRDFNNRNKILTSSGPIWLTVPVKSSNRFGSIISQTEIIDNGWNRKHLKSLELAYKKAPYFELYFEGLKKILQESYRYLADLNHDILLYALKSLDIFVSVSKASEHDFQGEKSALVLDMCKQLKSDIYIFGEQGKNYADEDSFKSHGVTPYFQSYRHPVYNQQSRKEFEPNMTVFDLLFNEGPNSKQILMSDNITKQQLLTIK